MFAMHAQLAAGTPINAVRLAHKLEVSARTVKRDIERLRDSHAAPIAWDPSARTYRYTAPFDLLSGLRLDADETLALVLAGRTFAAWDKTPLGHTLTLALQKIARFAGHAVSLPAADMRGVLFEPEADAGEASTDSEHRHFARLLDDILAHRELTLVYLKPNAPKPEPRIVRPLHLAYLDHRWMLVAEDIERTDWRNFLLGRIHQITPTGGVFEPPALVEIRRHLRGSLGRFTGSEEVEVRLVFNAKAAPYVRERPWHASQQLHSSPDGSAEVTLHLNNLIDVQRRVLACGSHVEVLAPPALRASIAAELKALANAYAAEIAAVGNPVSDVEKNGEKQKKNPAGQRVSPAT
jgi:predicted DNA-binding transcriptional regulator YafY